MMSICFDTKSLMTWKARRERVSQYCEVEQVPNGWRDNATQVVGTQAPIYARNEWYLTSFRIAYIFGTPRVSKDNKFRISGSHPDVIL